MVKLLDCTIRDGGHLNGWNFTEDCVRDSYLAALNAGVDYFEIGYRFDNPKPEWGNFARCEDDFLMKLIDKNEKCKLSVMIDAGKCSADKFKECKPENTIIDVVRVSTYPQHIDTAFELCEALTQKGYQVFINLMAISRYTDNNFDRIANWKNKTCLEGTCFADSYGALFPDNIKYFSEKLKSYGYKNICLHAHNNLQLAFANSLKAIEEDFYCIDASVLGMGRGAGILPAELIILYLNKCGNGKYNPSGYLNVIEKFYSKYYKQTPWGYNQNSLIGGMSNIHPNYINNLDKNLSTETVWNISQNLAKETPISYSDECLKIITNNYFSI